MEHPGEKHIDPRLLAKIKQSEKDGGIFLKDIPDRHIVEVHTQNSVYTIAVIDKDQSKVAIQGNNKHLLHPEVCYLRGSTFGGSMIKVGWIGVGMHLEVNPATGVIMTTSSVKTVKIKEDAKRAEELVKKALGAAPKEVTSEEAEESIRKFIRDKFPAAIREEVTVIGGAFSLNGKIAIVTLLESAHRHGKFEAAKTLIAKFMREHWGYQAPEVRGDPGFTQKNALYLERAYQELGLSLPSQEQELVEAVEDLKGMLNAVVDKALGEDGIPAKAFVVRTTNSVYRFGKADRSGARTVARDGNPLDFTRCRIKFLEVGGGMTLDCMNSPHPHWYTSTVRSIEK